LLETIKMIDLLIVLNLNLRLASIYSLILSYFFFDLSYLDNASQTLN